jgi:SAM-dependent methyltransferase
MAASQPAGRFVGCDLSPRALESARQTISALGLTNIALVEGSLTALPPEHGGFDFIIAHGVYSWVPPDVRDALFALASERLAQDGVLYASFNVLPAAHPPAAWMCCITTSTASKTRMPARCRARARALIAEGGTATHESDQALRAEFRAIAQHSDSELAHDDLAVPNDPVLFRHVRCACGAPWLALPRGRGRADDGRRGNLRRSESVSRRPRSARPRAVSRLLRLRRFAQSLLVRKWADGAHEDSSASRAMHVFGDVATAAAPTGGVTSSRRGSNRRRRGGAVRKLLDALVANTGGPYEIASLADRLHCPLSRLSKPILHRRYASVGHRRSARAILRPLVKLASRPAGRRVRWCPRLQARAQRHCDHAACTLHGSRDRRPERIAACCRSSTGSARSGPRWRTLSKQIRGGSSIRSRAPALRRLCAIREISRGLGTCCLAEGPAGTGTHAQ